METIIDDEAAMMALGEEIARKLQPGNVLALVGDLGAGKTHLSKGIVAGLNSRADVTSPTFSLVNEYRDGKLNVFHFDFYRLESVDELEQIGWEEYLEEDGVLIVEWADKFPEVMPGDTVWFHFEINEDGSRTIQTD
ncbi:MAG: tRNA (adenosine(37)-N6)-threonylcarbamoyltransferase complex ATPase subunit type 1 TsaE [Verrucomicrobiales bacterium]|nr:tRNA (adenosine(37)-N6)-threonylcarbamoyltransferase complex ATPase subunit type 1 TsaE [Verrucomicrobiales bacterium]